MSERAIFREQALDAYRRGTDKIVLPRLVSSRVTACAWLLLGVLLAAAVLAFTVRVPSYVAAPGLVTTSDPLRPASGAVVLFVPPDQSGQLRVGQPAHITVGSSETYVEGTVAQVGQNAVPPALLQQRYGVEPDLVSQPSVVVVVGDGEALPPDRYAGTRITAQVETGRQQPLLVIPGSS
ncbi:hypothetical protein HFP15_33400 [Amycolatopsis sp. K13G38]|uniref:HlyD family efflux transporter periplasmic adaptor subunit n=1 Tax=Amycolatopsis acididurans TaxID=2724524 RepID=A0ABX1JDF1_9PSEU|nr:hypothetical protein [Amycolatopsis acididurans]NKQ57768.1 hypothetical protein [Amycolatopsis acididurans]